MRLRRAVIYFADVKACNQFAQASPENFKRAALFVLATVQQQLETVPVALTDICKLGNGSRFAWGAKSKGVAYIEENYRHLYSIARHAADIESPRDLMQTFLQIPGLALVKAGFLCQIFAGSVGCIDTHNIKLYNIPLAHLRYRYELSETQRTNCVVRYVKLCEGLGGAHVLWSRWCDYVAKLRPYNWLDGAEVSRFHLDVINGTEDGGIVDLFSDVEFEPTFRS